MTDRVLCRYFVHGTCKKGDSCHFSHDWKNQASTICTFYQRGLCTYGNKCRYDHVKSMKSEEKATEKPTTQNSSQTLPSTLRADVSNTIPDTNVQNITSTSAGQSNTHPSYYNSYDEPWGGLTFSVYPENNSQSPENEALDFMSQHDWNQTSLSESSNYFSRETFFSNDPEISEFPSKPSSLLSLGNQYPGYSNYRSQETDHYLRNQLQIHSFDNGMAVSPSFTLQSSEGFSNVIPGRQAMPWTESSRAISIVSPAQDHLELGELSGLSLKDLEGPADRPLCEVFTVQGECASGDQCKKVHGTFCETCKKFCLHPLRPDEAEDHVKSCTRSHKLLEALQKSQEIECSVCLERVLSKLKISERKFGVLSHCDHAFCIACIRGWRGGTHSMPGMDLDGVVRACPVCRVQSHYVIPSVVWYFSAEEKDAITKGYKRKINDIDCKHFDFGNATCPFGTSCFYKHAYKDGTREEIKLRHLASADGSTVIAKEVRLSDFLSPVLGKK